MHFSSVSNDTPQLKCKCTVETKQDFNVNNSHVMNVNRTVIFSYLNPLTPISDQGRISPYNINTISSRQVMRIKKNINEGIIS